MQMKSGYAFSHFSVIFKESIGAVLVSSIEAE